MIAHKTKAAMPGRLSHNALLKQGQITRLTAGGQTLYVSVTDSQISSVRQTYGHHNVLKLFQTGDSRSAFDGRNVLKNIQTPDLGSAQNAHNPLILFQTVNIQSAQNVPISLSQLNYREMRELDNPLNRLDYNESLESANPLIIAKNANSVGRVQSGSGKNNVKRGLEVPTNIVGSCEDDGKNHHEENQKYPALGDENRLSLSESDSLPTGGGLVTYKNFVGQILCGTQRPAQHKPEIIGAVHSMTGSNPVQAKKKGRISDPTLWLVSCRQIWRLGYSPISLSAILMTLSNSLRALAAPSRMWVIASSAERMASSAEPPIWRRTISPRIAVTIKFAVDSSCSFTVSIASMISCGTRAASACDLAFFVPVAMLLLLNFKCATVYVKSVNKKRLTCSPPCDNFVYTLIIQGTKTAKPGSAGTLTGPLTTNR